MKRTLTDTEKKLSEKGLKRIDNEIKDLKEKIIYYEKTKEYMKAKRDYEDFTRPYNRKAQDEEMEKEMKTAQQMLIEFNNQLKVLKEQIQHGVEEKKNSLIG